jgi:hypothetical protein
MKKFLTHKIIDIEQKSSKRQRAMRVLEQNLQKNY